jgi:hypothetical protein
MNPTLLRYDPQGRCGTEGLKYSTWRTRDPQGRLSAAPLARFNKNLEEKP